jgi:hypothetical protein
MMDDRDAEIARLRAVLKKIANPLSCGCRPCTGQCCSHEALRITVEEMRSAAHAALESGAMIYVCQDCDCDQMLGSCLECRVVQGNAGRSPYGIRPVADTQGIRQPTENEIRAALDPGTRPLSTIGEAP